MSMKGQRLMMNAPMRITVVIPTHNRAKTLGKALESITAQVLPASISWEILLVDNNSTDETRQVVDEWQRQYPNRIRYLLEPRLGLSNARNAGVANAKGEILAFIDDDETAPADWLHNLTASLHGNEWAGAGGRVLSEWKMPRPRWLAAKGSFCLGPLAAFDPDISAGQMTDPPVGANMAFRKEVFDRYGLFRADLGRTGHNLLGNEDIEFGRRLLAAGQRLRYEPAAVTYHPVSETRVRREYFLGWWFNKGRSDVIEFGIDPNVKHLFGIPLGLFRPAAVELVRWAIAIEPSRRFVSKLKVWTYAGLAFESRRQLLLRTGNAGRLMSTLSQPRKSE